MTRVDVWLLHVSNGLVTATGLVYAWMVYMIEPDDPYAVSNHPWQSDVQHAHILVAPLLVFVLGHLWHRHAWPHYRDGVRKGKRSGMAMVLMALPMVVSGYLIQTAVQPEWRTAWVVVHCTASALWITGYAAHVVRHRFPRRARVPATG